MSRNGSGVYSLPAIYEAVAGETILATQHNTPLEDLEADMNLVRPIVAGGTGGSTIAAAKTALYITHTMQEFTASGTWTKPANCRFVVVEAVGGGGGGGGVDGQGAGMAAAAGGGSSGAFGRTTYIDVTAISTGTVTIGAAGAAGSSGANNGGTGGNTSIVLGATTYTWAGGLGGFGITASTSAFNVAQGQGMNSGSANVLTTANQGENGYSGAGSMVGTGGQGGSSPYGQGGARTYVFTSGTVTGNAPGSTSYGAGGGGASCAFFTTNAAGGAGKAGYMRVWEFY
jgi:hypothetical protein